MGDSWECYATPLGLKIIIGYVLRVAAFAATLSFMTQPRWGKKLIFTFNLTAMPLALLKRRIKMPPLPRLSHIESFGFNIDNILYLKGMDNILVQSVSHFPDIGTVFVQA